MCRPRRQSGYHPFHTPHPPPCTPPCILACKSLQLSASSRKSRRPRSRLCSTGRSPPRQGNREDTAAQSAHQRRCTAPASACTHPRNSVCTMSPPLARRPDSRLFHSNSQGEIRRTFFRQGQGRRRHSSAPPSGHQPCCTEPPPPCIRPHTRACTTSPAPATPHTHPVLQHYRVQTRRNTRQGQVQGRRQGQG